MEWKLGLPAPEDTQTATETNAGAPPVETPPPATSTPPAETPPVETPPADAPKPVADDDLVKILNDRGISLAKLDDIKAAFESNKTYGEQVNGLNKQIEELNKRELQFPNDKAKEIYQFALKFPGNELAAARNLLNLSGIDLEKADSKQLQFEAFVLQHPSYPREEAKAIFEAKYEKTYGDGTGLSSDVLLKFEHDQATIAARQSIAAAVKNFNEAKLPEPTQQQQQPAGPTPEQIDAVKRGVDSGLKDFKGSTINLPEYKTKEGVVVPASALNLELKPEEATKFRDYLENPESFLRDVIMMLKGEKGIDWNGYTHLMGLMYGLANNPQEFYAKIQSQSVEKGMLIMLEKIKNSGGQKSPEAGGDGTVVKSKSQQFRESRQSVEV
jgi:hypothetical protein